MSLDSSFIYYEDNIGKFTRLQHTQHVSMQVSLWYLYTNIQHPDVVEGEFTVIAAKDIQLSLYNIGCMSTMWPWSVVTCLYFFPNVLFNVKNMNIVHPVSAIIAAEVVYFRVYKAPCRRNSRTWLLASDLRLDPCQRACVQIENVIELSVLVWLSPKDVNLLFKCYC